MVTTRSRRGKPLPRPPQRGKKYKANDECKRHRIKDKKPKTVRVVAHSRRK